VIYLRALSTLPWIGVWEMNASFSMRRVLLISLIVTILAGTGLWYRGYFQPFGLYRPANSIMVLAPYRHAGTWVFDDVSVGLKKEAFVAGIPELMDAMVKDIPDADNGFRMLFSAQPFPGYTHKLTWLRGDNTGNWYYSEQYKKEGWLCPGLLKYFRDAPKELYVKAEKK